MWRFFLVFSLPLAMLACKRDHALLVLPEAEETEIIQTPDSIPNPGQTADPTHLPQVADSMLEAPEAQTIRFLALGDSYTIGQSVDSALRWPAQLAERLTNESSSEVSELKYIAQTGWTTFGLSSAMDSQMIDTASYDLVSLLIGVNNQFSGGLLSDYIEDYPVLLERAIAIAGGDVHRVFVVSIPDYGYTPFGEGNQTQISTELQSFNDACMNLTEAAGVTWYNITPISQQYPEVPDLVASDGLHPSGYQYALWVDSFYEDVREKLEQ